MEERGALERKERSPEQWKQIAINEAATAVVAVNFPDLRNIEFVWFTNFKSVVCVCVADVYTNLYWPVNCSYVLCGYCHALFYVISMWINLEVANFCN